MFGDELSIFVENILKEIKKKGLDVSDLPMDHPGYQASSDEDYDRLIPEFEKIGIQLSEAIVGGRRVGIFELDEDINFDNYTISAIEVFAPVPGTNPKSGWEHVEFILEEGFDDFMDKYPDLDWNVSAKDQKEFPMIKLKLTEDAQIKFQLRGVIETAKVIN